MCEDFRYNILLPISALWGIVSAIVAGILISKRELHFLIILLSVIIVLSQILFTIVWYLRNSQDKFYPKSVFSYIQSIIDYHIFGIGVEGSQVWWMSMIGMCFKRQEMQIFKTINMHNLLVPLKNSSQIFLMYALFKIYLYKSVIFFILIVIYLVIHSFQKIVAIIFNSIYDLHYFLLIKKIKFL